jgi:hypothetical protein
MVSGAGFRQMCADIAPRDYRWCGRTAQAFWFRILRRLDAHDSFHM